MDTWGIIVNVFYVPQESDGTEKLAKVPNDRKQV